MPGSDKPAPPIDLSKLGAIAPELQRGVDLRQAHSVVRRNAKNECGEFIGNVNVLKNDGHIEAIAFFCSGPKLHKNACAFATNDGIVVTRRGR